MSRANPPQDQPRRDADQSRLLSVLDELDEPIVANQAADAPITEFLWGLPGTGKTTTLMEILEEELGDGVDALDIAGVTFRRSMAREFAERANEHVEVELFPDDPDEAPPDHWFRTTHSACYKLVGLTPDDIVTESNRREFCEQFGVEYQMSSSAGPENELDADASGFAIGGSALGNQMFQLRSHELNRLHNPLDSWQSSPMTTFDIRDRVASNRTFVRDFNRAYEQYKERNGLVDYDDMLLETLADGLVPPVDVLIEDEFQDKTLLQLAVFAQWASSERIDRVYVAGDEKQALYSFLGAEPRVFEYMRSRADERGVLRVLDTTYRVSSNIWNYAEAMFVEDSLPVEIDPADDGGVVRTIPFADYERDVADDPDVDTLHLVRTNYLGSDVLSELDAAGIAYDSPGTNGGRDQQRLVYETIAEFVRAVDSARDEFGSYSLDTLEPETIERILPMLPADWFVGTKTDAKGAIDENETIDLGEYLDPKAASSVLTAETPFDVLVTSAVSRSPDVRDRLKSLWKRRGASAFDDVNHTVTTIHGAKGMERTRVYLHDRSTARIQRNCLESRAARLEEQRVWFVGATRAADELVIVEHEGARHTQDLPQPSRSNRSQN